MGEESNSRMIHDGKVSLFPLLILGCIDKLEIKMFLLLQSFGRPFH